MTFLVQPTPHTARPEQALFPLTSFGQQPPTNTWCKWTACHCVVLRALSSWYCLSSATHMHHSLCLPHVLNRGEHEWVTHLSVPLICSYVLYFPYLIDRVSERGLGLSGWAPSEQEHSQLAFAKWAKAHLSSQTATVTPPRDSLWSNSQLFKHNLGCIMKYQNDANINNL